MGRYWLHDLPAALRDAGLNVETVAGWETRSRSSGGFEDIQGVAWHHTAGGGNDKGQENYAYFVSPDRPVGNLHLRFDGTWVMGAAGAANTMGKGGPVTGSKGTIPLNDGNRRMVAIEAHNDGIGQNWPEVQIDSYFAGTLVICDLYGLNPLTDVWTHFGYCRPSCPGRKIDPAKNTAVSGPWRPMAELTSGTSRTWSEQDIRIELDSRRKDAEPVKPVPPTPPTNVRLEDLPLANNYGKATWSAPDNPGTSDVWNYIVQLEMQSNPDVWVDRGQTGRGDVLTKNVYAWANGAAHRVRVLAQNSEGKSGWAYSPYAVLRW